MNLYPPEVYPSPEAYVAACEAGAMRFDIPSPANMEQQLALAYKRPDLARFIWPTPEICDLLGIKHDPHDYTAELDDDEKNRFLYSLVKDEKFLQSVRRLLGVCQ